MKLLGERDWHSFMVFHPLWLDCRGSYGNPWEYESFKQGQRAYEPFLREYFYD